MRNYNSIVSFEHFSQTRRLCYITMYLVSRIIYYALRTNKSLEILYDYLPFFCKIKEWVIRLNDTNKIKEIRIRSRRISVNFNLDRVRGGVSKKNYYLREKR